MISFIKKLTVHAQFLVFNQTWKTYKKNLKETLISISIKKNQFRNILVRNLPNPNILIATNQNLQKKIEKETLRTFLKIQKKKKKKETLKTFLKIQKKRTQSPYLPYYQSPVRKL